MIVGINPIDVLRYHIKDKYGTQAEASRQWGCSPVFVHAMLSGRKPLPDYILDEIGLIKVVSYAYRTQLI